MKSQRVTLPIIHPFFFHIRRTADGQLAVQQKPSVPHHNFSVFIPVKEMTKNSAVTQAETAGVVVKFMLTRL